MPSLKGLACISLLTLAIAAPPALAQSNDTTPRAPTTMPGTSSATPADQQTGQQKHKHHRRSRTTATPQGQANPAASDPR